VISPRSAPEWAPFSPSASCTARLSCRCRPAPRPG
jgi:hypothetical protein